MQSIPLSALIGCNLQFVSVQYELGLTSKKCDWASKSIAISKQASSSIHSQWAADSAISDYQAERAEKIEIIPFGPI